MNKTVIVIPSRYASSRFPGKPLAKINGFTLLHRVVALAQYVAKQMENVSVLVATEDPTIAKHAKDIGAASVLTSAKCPTGSDRVLEALRKTEDMPRFAINLQGDAPFTDPYAIKVIIEAFQKNPQLEVVTPVHRLTWSDLERLRKAKQTTPFSGTTAIVNQDGQAIWFSKAIIPTIRDEPKEKEKNRLSPVHQHMGLYGFRTDILEKFCALKPSFYEELEGLEQLRMVENGIKVQTIDIDIEPGRIQSGIDSMDDLTRAEARIREFGDPMDRYKPL